MTQRIRILLFISCCIALRVSARAQEVLISAKVDSNQVIIGDWIRLTVQLKKPASQSVVFPLPADTLGHFSVLTRDSMIAEEQNGIVSQTQVFTLAAYEAGSFAVPPLSASYRRPGDTVMYTASTNPIPVEVMGVEVDTTQGLKDIKAPLSVPLSWKEILLYASIALFCCAVLYAAYYYWKKKKIKQGEEPEEIAVIPAHIRAMVKLKELEGKRLWQTGEIKAFYSEATEIIREYFERRYKFLALEMTTDEIIERLKNYSLPPESLAVTSRMLSEADLVKFAKFFPTPPENEKVIPDALMIVEQTKEREEVQEDV